MKISNGNPLITKAEINITINKTKASLSELAKNVKSSFNSLLRFIDKRSELTEKKTSWSYHKGKEPSFKSYVGGVSGFSEAKKNASKDEPISFMPSARQRRLIEQMGVKPHKATADYLYQQKINT